MSIQEELTQLNEPYELVYEKKYGKIFLLKDKGIIIGELTEDYVPIDKFRKFFGKLGEFIQQHAIQKFIFDKRKLQTFHQPSMEWYFLTWKEEMFHKGMKTHRKMLPPNDLWFKEAVLAGRAKILQENPENIIDQLDIQYRDSLEDAIED